MPHGLRFALRALRKSPLFAAVAVVSLGLALALNTTMFALVDSLLHPTVPYPEPERLLSVRLWGGDQRRPLPPGERFRAVSSMRSYAGLAAVSMSGTRVRIGNTEVERGLSRVTLNFFEVMGVRPLLGRALGPADAAPGADAAVISYRTWRVHFGGRPLSDGLRLDAGGRALTVVGVMPPGMRYGGDVWVPWPADTPAGASGEPVMRLKPGVTREAAQAEAALIAKRLTTEFGTPERPYAARLVDATPMPRQVEAIHKLLVATAAVVLLIACANLATMMLARGLARRRDTAVRIALGAGRGAIIREVLAECGILTLAGGALGVLLTVWSIFVLSTKATRYIDALGDVSPIPSWRVFAFAFGVSALTMLLAGVLPARRAAATDPTEPMKEGSGNTTGRVRDRYNPLVIVEITLSTALLMGAALLTLSVFRLSAFQWRFDARRVLTSSFDLRWTVRGSARDSLNGDRFWEELLVRAQRLPGVRAAATSHRESPDGNMVVGEAGKSGERWLNLRWYTVVSPDYLRTLGIPVLQGRDFAPGDRNPIDSVGGVVIVDEDAARRLWLDLASPVGRLVKLGDAQSKRPWLRVVGVARSVEDGPRDDPYLAPDPTIYVVLARDSATGRTLWVRGAEEQRAGSPLALTLRREIEALQPRLAWVHVLPATYQVDARVELDRFLARLFAAFSAFALVLSGVGLYGVVAYAVSRRMREFAVRVALGARRRHVVRLVLHDVVVMALAGIGIGAFVALVAAPAVNKDAYGTPYEAVLALVAAEAVLALVAVLACVGPLRRAAAADPVEILRAT